MKVTAVLAIFISAVAAQTACDAAASAIPSCGVPCITSAAVAVGCNNVDYRCRCSSSSAIQSSAGPCVISACGFLDAIQVQQSASAVCACVATATGAMVPVITAF